MPTPAEFASLLELALAEAQAGTARIAAEYRLAELFGWSLDEAAGELVFGPHVRFVAQVVGVRDRADRWTWAWADPSLPAALVRAAADARGWGEANGVARLTTPAFPADEAECWKLTAFAARLVGLPAVYRGPSANGTLFLAFGPLPPGHGLAAPEPPP
jgi:hypothetical protein